MTTAPTTEIEQPAILATAPGRPPLDPAHQAVVDERKANRGVGRPRKEPTRDALIALQYRKMQGLQAHVLDRLEQAVLNPADPIHAMVMEKLMARAVPQAFWDALAKQEFAAGDDGKQTPSVTIVIGTQAGVTPAVDVVSTQ